jgi:hypothetical protein
MPKVIASLVFHEDSFDPGEEASLRNAEIGRHSKEGFVGGGVPHPTNLISYPLYRQTPIDVVVATHAAHGRASTALATKFSQGLLEVAPMSTAISMQRS